MGSFNLLDMDYSYCLNLGCPPLVQIYSAHAWPPCTALLFLSLLSLLFFFLFVWWGMHTVTTALLWSHFGSTTEDKSHGDSVWVLSIGPKGTSVPLETTLTTPKLSTTTPTPILGAPSSPLSRHFQPLPSCSFNYTGL